MSKDSQFLISKTGLAAAPMSVTKLGAKVIHRVSHRYQESSVSDECRVCGKGETDRIHVDNRVKK